MKVDRAALACLLIVGCSGGSPGGGSGQVIVDPAVSAAWQWTPCWRVPASPAARRVKFAPDGKLAIMYEDGRTIFQAPTWDAPAREIHFASTGDVSFSFDGALLAGSSNIVRVADGSVVSTLAPPSDGYCATRGVRFSMSGDYVLSYGGVENGGGDTCVWRTADGSLVTQIRRDFVSAAFQGDQVIALNRVSPSETLTVDRYDLAGTRLAPPPIDMTGVVAFFDAVIAPDGSTLLAGYSDAPDASTWLGGAWDLTDGRRLWATADVIRIDDTGFSPRGDLFATQDAVIQVRDGAALRRATAGNRWVFDWGVPPSVSPAGDTVAGVASRQFPLVVDLVSWERRLLGSHSDPLALGLAVDHGGVRSLSLSRDGSTLISLADGGAIAWRYSPGRAPSHPVALGQGPAYSRADVSPDGHWVSLVGDGRVIASATSLDNVWLGPPDSVLLEPEPCVWPQLQFSPDGRWVAGGGYGHFIDVMLVDGFTKVAELRTAGCPRVAFTGDGKRLVTSGGQTFRVGDWRQLEAASLSVPQPGFYDDFVMAPDGVGRLGSTCTQVSASRANQCRTDYRGARPELTAPFPRFSPEGHWITAGATQLHAPSGATRTLDDATAMVSMFTPEGDIIAGGSDGSLAGFCRR
jgi:hypothetical protein